MTSPVSMQQLIDAGTDCGTVAAIATSTANTVVDRLGQTKLTMVGACNKIGFEQPTAYSAGGQTLNRPTQTVVYEGLIYAPAYSTSFPFTTSGTFNPLLWRTVSTEELKFKGFKAALLNRGGITDNGLDDSTIQSQSMDALDKLYYNKSDTIYVSSFIGTDAQKVQAAVDKWATNKTQQIHITGSYDLTGATIRVANVETEVPENQLVFWGGELVKNDAGFMFDKPATGQAQSTGGIRFFGTKFRSDVPLNETYIINAHHDFLETNDSTHILRTAFIGCMGVGIKVAKTSPSGYMQSISMDANCVWRGWRGFMFDCGFLYDLNITTPRFETGDAVLKTRKVDADPACNSLKIFGGVIEGLAGQSGPALQTGACFASSVILVYQEKNSGGDYDFSQGTAFHKGLTVTGCGFQPTTAQLTDINYFPIKLGLGAEQCFNLGGNSSTGNLYSASLGNQATIQDIGSYVPTGKIKFGPNCGRRIEQTANAGFKVQLTDGFGASLNGYYGALEFESSRRVVMGESVAVSVLKGEFNPQSSPGNYGNRKWAKGTQVVADGVTVTRNINGAANTMILKGWICLADSSVTYPHGLWAEDLSLIP